MSIRDSDLGTESDKASGGGAGSNRPVRFAVWGAVLAFSTAGLTAANPAWLESLSSLRSAFYALTFSAYLVAFTHCLIRLIYSRWLGWLLFTAGFAGMSAASLIGVAADSGSLASLIASEQLDLLARAALSLACALHLSAVYVSTAGVVKGWPGTWKSYLRLAILGAAAVVVFRSGAYLALREAISRVGFDTGLATGAACVASLVALLYLMACRTGPKETEIIVPVGYWAVAMTLRAVLDVGDWQHPGSMWWQCSWLEFAGISALLLGLSLANERAHRDAARELADLQATQKISWSLVGASNLSDLTAALAGAISDGFGAAPVAVYLPNDDSEEMVIAATSGVDGESVTVGKICSLKPGHRPGFHTGHTARAYASGQVQVVEEVFSDVEFMPWRMVARSTGVAVSVPLQHQDRSIGVVNLFFEGIDSPDESRISLLEAIAAAVSPAIQNIRLQSDLEAQLKAA